MFKRVLFFLLFAVSALPAQENKLQQAIKQANLNKPLPQTILEIEQLVSVSKDEIGKMKAYTILGETYTELEVYDKAYGFYLRAFQLAQKHQRFKEMGLAKEDLGNIQFRLGNYENCIQLFSDSKKYFEKIGDFDGIIRAKGNMAIVAIKTNQRQRGIQSLIEIKNSAHLNLATKATTLLTLGNVYLEASQTNKAIAYYLETVSCFEHKTADLFKVIVYQNLAESYIALQQYDQAFHYNHESERILQKTNSNEMKSSLYFLYSEINQGKSQFKEAFENLKLHQKFKTLSDDSKDALKIQNLETRNKIKQQQLDLQIKENKIKLLQSEKSAARIKIGLLVLMVIGILFLVIYLVKKQRKKVKSLSHTISQTEDQLGFSQTKTDKMVLNIVKNNDFIEHFRESLKQIQTQTNDTANRTALNTLIVELQNFRLINDTQDDLFNQVDVQFKYKLKKKYPTLTDEEQKMGMLIYLNLKNKDIAVILKLSVRSVENCRYRIRKKMNLEPNDSLSEVLKNL